MFGIFHKFAMLDYRKDLDAVSFEFVFLPWHTTYLEKWIDLNSSVAEQAQTHVFRYLTTGATSSRCKPMSSGIKVLRLNSRQELHSTRLHNKLSSTCKVPQSASVNSRAFSHALSSSTVHPRMVGIAGSWSAYGYCS